MNSRITVDITYDESSGRYTARARRFRTYTWYKFVFFGKKEVEEVIVDVTGSGRIPGMAAIRALRELDLVERKAQSLVSCATT